MYKSRMMSASQNEVSINTWSPKPGVTVWYSKIPDIRQSIFCKSTYHNFNAMVNEIFQKDDFATSLFNADEIKSINGFKALKKQIEWICGRYLIKQMLHAHFFKNKNLAQINLSYRNLGAPYISNSPDIPISLSHSNDYTAAACAKNINQTIGLDIEKIDRKPDAHFLKTAFTQKERSHLKDTALDIFTHWTMKEAFLKYIKKGFNESLHKVEVIQNKIYHHDELANVEIHTKIIDDSYVLSLVCDS